jgi:serine carboxypeptidase-like clade 2
MINADILMLALLLSGAHCYAFDRVYPELFTNVAYGHEMYSGYLDAGFNKSFFYQFYYSQGNPTKDPVLLWLNGGPGCSSLLGAFTENGPFEFYENTSDLKLNPNSWNRYANVLYLESPGGVGFSQGPVNSSDASVAQDNLVALMSFFQKFPKFQAHDFYISGESYAGIYVPRLAL